MTRARLKSIIAPFAIVVASMWIAVGIEQASLAYGQSEARGEPTEAILDAGVYDAVPAPPVVVAASPVVIPCKPGTAQITSSGEVTCDLMRPIGEQVSDPVATRDPETGLVTDPVVPPPPPQINAEDPGETIAAIVTFWRSGKGRVAFGFGVVLFVWIVRKLLVPRVAWFATKAGGYLLNFGTAGLLYIGGALVGDVALTFNLLGDAFTSAMAASGGWHALQDFIARPGASA